MAASATRCAVSSTSSWLRTHRPNPLLPLFPRPLADGAWYHGCGASVSGARQTRRPPAHAATRAVASVCGQARHGVATSDAGSVRVARGGQCETRKMATGSVRAVFACGIRHMHRLWGKILNESKLVLLDIAINMQIYSPGRQTEKTSQ